jgi:hypothetical protein
VISSSWSIAKRPIASSGDFSIRFYVSEGEDRLKGCHIPTSSEGDEAVKQFLCRLVPQPEVKKEKGGDKAIEAYVVQKELKPDTTASKMYSKSLHVRA